jgi:outer membrane biosynthesis protein TonB
MPYELETDKLSHKFINVTQIAILLSVGLHLLLYKYGFPTLLIKEKLNNKDKTVATVELSPVEQARIPDLESGWNPPSLNNTLLDDEAAPPFALPLPPNFTPSTNLPSVPIPPGYNFPNLPSINSNNIELPPLGVTDLSKLPLPPPIDDLDSLTSPDVPLTTPEKPQNSKPTREKLPTPKPSEVKAPLEEEKTEATKPTPQQIAAAARKQKLTKNLRDVSISLRQQNTATTDEEARKNYISWLSKIEDAKPETVELQGIYPRDACIRQLEGESVYGVLINAKNEIVGLELIKGAKYPLFNEQASEDIQKHDFANETKKTKPYQITVDYKYDRSVCPSLTLPSLREKEQLVPELEPKPELEDEQTPTAEPKPEAKPAPIPPSESKPEDKQPSLSTPKPKPEDEQTPTSAPEPKPKPEAEQLPTPVSEPKLEAEQPPSLRERLENTPLPNNDTIRERLQKVPLPEK